MRGMFFPLKPILLASSHPGFPCLFQLFLLCFPAEDEKRGAGDLSEAGPERWGALRAVTCSV